MKALSKTEKVLRHLLKGKTLTQAQAVRLFQAYRLASIIYALKDKGHDIISIPKHSKPDSSGYVSNYVEYKINVVK